MRIELWYFHKYKTLYNYKRIDLLRTLPILLKDQEILLIGTGNVAKQKADVLNENNIKFKTIDKIFKIKHIKKFFIIIDATGNPKVLKKLLKYKKTNNVLLNIVDVPLHCDFYFMALTSNKPLQIAVSSNGSSPTAAKFFRDECEKLIPKDISSYLDKKQKERLDNNINVRKTNKELKLINTQVYLVGCGIGDPELLTIKAYNIIKNVDVVLIDHLISDEIIELIPKKTKKIFVGKQKGFHSKSQEEINFKILKYAKKGLSVARLKSGDPFVFGRGSEELEAISSLNIPVQVIPGISSAISAPLLANIPITARGYASSFSVVSAHLKNNSINLDWIELLKKENHTVVVLMGLSRVKEIVNEAKKLNIAPNKPCAIISNASRKNQKVIITNLDELKKSSKKAVRPAIIVFGDVVNYLSKL